MLVKKVSKVFFADAFAKDYRTSLLNKIELLWETAGFSKLIKKGDLVAIKVHFGEIGNNTFIPPWYVRVVVDKIKENGGKPFITDCNTVYVGSRRYEPDHIQNAYLHGFTYSTTGAPVIIADGLKGRNYESLEINKKHFKSVKIGSDLVHADALIVISHFKMHLMAGFGGAIKNIGMGAGSVQGKKEQHAIKPFLADEEKCTGCGTCKTQCPTDAILIVDKKYTVDENKCIGCGTCVGVCPEDALAFNWGEEIAPFTERMTEYAYGVWKHHQGKIGFFNFAINITPECDCFGTSEPIVVRDIGIFASTDPVAIDKACYDAVNTQEGLKSSRLKKGFKPGENKFTGVHEGTKGHIQFEYGEELGMGNQKYEKIEVKPPESEE
ncbi:MAG: DUF362 domain-containing protein [Candidatus Lokiarchaeota archaeon]|nr:DUF362 domain-containing protein [Candidatus Lokiarchaeota archaeon]